MGQFKVVIIGAGAISRVAHLPAVLASPYTRLAGLVDPDVARAKLLCRDYGLSVPTAADIEHLGVTFDGAIVAAPNDLHAAIALDLVRQGIPVLVEKPVATVLSAAQELVAAARAGNVVVAVGYHTRHSGACRALKRAVETQHFGPAVRFAHQDGSRGGWSPLSGYNLDGHRAGGGVLVTTGIHFLDRLVWLWGRPDAVELSDNAAGGPENHCIAHFEYRRSGHPLRGSAIFSKMVSLPEDTVVETPEGILAMPSDAADAITFSPRRDRSLVYRVGSAGASNDPRSLYQRELEDFVRACVDHGKPCVDAEEAAQSLELLLRLYANRRPLVAPGNQNSVEMLRA